MQRRTRNTLFFLCSLVGAMLLVLGLMELGDGDRDGWLYLLGAALSFACLFSPGVRAKRLIRPPDE